MLSQWGAPIVLYRAEHTVDSDDYVYEDFSFYRRLMRAQTRWYLPTDHRPKDPVVFRPGDVRKKREAITGWKITADRMLDSYDYYDSNGIPEADFSAKANKATYPYDCDRLNYSDPSYLTAFPEDLVGEIGKEEKLASSIRLNGTNYSSDIPKLRPQHPDHYSNFGNCVHCVKHDHHVVVVHPTGALQDKLRASFLSFRNLRMGYKGTNGPRFREFAFTDRIRQIERVGESRYFVVRTSCSVSLILLILHIGDTFNADIRELQSFDRRTLFRDRASWIPHYLAAHPNYDITNAPANVAVLYKSENKAIKLERWNLTDDGCKTTEVDVANLEDMSQFQFGQHPMVLWASARSYVRPAVTAGYTKGQMKLGHGMGIYSIDFRSGRPTYQWSPSSSEYQPEGTYSVSGLHVDQSTSHRLWVASVDARKTWEVDSRMPLRAVNTWTLDHACSSKTHDPPHRGFLFNSLPDGRIVSTGTFPKAYGLNVYERSSQHASGSFTSRPTEATTGCKNGLTPTVTTFELPDVNKNTFVTGLSSFSKTVDSFVRQLDLDGMDYFPFNNSDPVTTVVTTTNAGDLFAQVLVPSRQKGESILEVAPKLLEPLPMMKGRNKPWNVCDVILTNDVPIHRRALKKLLRKKPLRLEEPDNNDQEQRKEPTRMVPIDFGSQPRVPVNISTGEESSTRLHLPENLLAPKSRKVAHFLPPRRSILEKQQKTTGLRSDLTPDLLTKVWDDSDSDDLDF